MFNLLYFPIRRSLFLHPLYSILSMAICALNFFPHHVGYVDIDRMSKKERNLRLQRQH